MGNSQAEQMFDALFGLSQAQTGKMQALEIAVRAMLVSTVAPAPDDGEAFLKLIKGMAEEERAAIDQESVDAFDNTIESMTDLISAILAHRG